MSTNLGRNSDAYIRSLPGRCPECAVDIETRPHTTDCPRAKEGDDK